MNIQEIRAKLPQHNIEAYVITHNNRFIGQDILQNEHKLKQLCGFSGSAGIAVITSDDAYLLVDGRYTLQARLETESCNIKIVEAMPRLKNVCDLLQEKNIWRIGYDSWNHSAAEMDFICRRYKNMEFIDIADSSNSDSKNPISAMLRQTQFSGLSTAEKCQTVVSEIKKQAADYFLITAADSVSWLTNLYAHDLPCSPIIRAYALVDKQGKITLFADNLQADIEVKNFSDLIDFLQDPAPKKILYDAHTTPQKIKNFAHQNTKLYKTSDICALTKIVKNPTELQGMINCHIRDGVAIVKLLMWIEDNWRGLKELDIVEKLHQLRAVQPHFFSESFETIAASGPNGAIVHYHPNPKSNANLTENSLLLLDCGAQYLDGTTDVTRTIALGTPSNEMIADFTAVLKAHIALARSRFPQETSGSKLDILARAQMWQNGADYAHGTGHGVACFGNVHEGPISISYSRADYGFKANMVTSDEPGIYKEQKYGIRIENLQYTAPVAEHVGFLEFKYLTKVPIDKKLIAAYLLSGDELAWLNKYHQDVYESLAPYLSEAEKIWLKGACSPL